MPDSEYPSRELLHSRPSVATYPSTHAQATSQHQARNVVPSIRARLIQAQYMTDDAEEIPQSPDSAPATPASAVSSQVAAEFAALGVSSLLDTQQTDEVVRERLTLGPPGDDGVRRVHGHPLPITVTQQTCQVVRERLTPGPRGDDGMRRVHGHPPPVTEARPRGTPVPERAAQEGGEFSTAQY